MTLMPAAVIQIDSFGANPANRRRASWSLLEGARGPSRSAFCWRRKMMVSSRFACRTCPCSTKPLSKIWKKTSSISWRIWPTIWARRAGKWAACV
jgi:hypothetical protein